MRATVATAVCALVLLVAAPLRAQAWIASPGDGYASVGLQLISGSKAFDATGGITSIEDIYRQTSVTAYAEVGVIERWLMLTAGGEVYRNNTWERHARTVGMGDLRLGAYTGLLQGRVNLSAGLEVGLPTGDGAPMYAIPPDDEAIGQALVLPTGDGEVDVTPRVAFGTSLGGARWPLGHYAQVTAGARLRTAGLHHGMAWSAELGTSGPSSISLDRLWLVVRVAGEETFAPSGTGGGFTGLGDGVAWRSYELALRVEIAAGIGVWGRYASAFSARNVIAASPLGAGVDVRW